MKSFSLSAIIPIHNEEQTVAYVVNQVVKSGLFNEVICVNDGSTDNTQKILKTFLPQIKIIRFAHNHGKGGAMAAGLERSSSNIVAFIDADLLNFEKIHLLKLINPLLKGQADAVLLGRKAKSDLNAFTGERAYFRQDILPLANKLKDCGYGAETLLNLYCQKNNKKVKIIQSDHDQLIKPKKYGLTGPMLTQYAQMILDVSKAFAKENGFSAAKARQLRQKIRQYLKRYREFLTS